MQKRLGMKKLGLFFILLALISCSKKKEQPIMVPQPMEIKTIMDSIDFDKDSLIDVEGMGKISLDSFLKIKDSLVYVTLDIDKWTDAPYWMTKDLYKWNFGYPDSITVKWHGYSLKISREGLAYDKNGKAYSPAYVEHCPSGDTQVWDVNGKYLGLDVEH